MVVLRRGPGALSWLAFAWTFPSLVFAGVVNRTIDDTFGDSQTGLQVTYLPGGGVWKDETCIGCAINPDVENAFKETYTASTYNPGLGSTNITMQFNGTAIYVFFILANNQGDGITTLTLANFTLDGNAPQLFQHAPDLTTTNFEFNQLVFSQTNLINAQHTLVVSTSGVDSNVYVNFDYAIYTHDDDAPLLPLTQSPIPSTTPSITPSLTPSLTPTNNTTVTPGATVTATSTALPSPSALGNVSNTKSEASNAGPIAGGVVVAFLIIALIAFLIYFYRRRRRSKLSNAREGEGYIPPLMGELDPGRDRQATIISPFVQPAPSTTHRSGSLREYAPVSANSMSRLSMPLSNTEPPIAPSETESAYGGYIIPGTSSNQISYASSSAPSNSDINYQGGQNRRLLRSVTNGDHLSPGEDMTSTPSLQTPNSIEAIRLARQNELDERLRTVQEEMVYLASDLNSGEKNGRSRSVRRRTANRHRPEEGGEAAEEEMSMSDMREQLRLMREQIAFLQDQQRSAWAQGLSDDPPPGYTATRASSRYSAPPPTAALTETSGYM